MARSIVSVKLEGFEEINRALKELGKAVSEKTVLRRVLTERAKPMLETARSKATRRSGALANSFAISTRLSGRQRAMHKKTGDKEQVEVFVGAGPLPQAHLEEFGSIHNEPNPMMRPAWDAHHADLLEGIGDDLWAEITKAVAKRSKRLSKFK